MEQKRMRKVFRVQGMSCPSCEVRIEKALGRMKGVVKVSASLAKSQVVVEYDPEIMESGKLEDALAKLGYEVGPADENLRDDSEKRKTAINQWLGIGIIIFALYFVIKATVGFNFIPQIDQSVGYGMLFVIGLVTSLHCIAMCGGINLSQSMSRQPSGNISGKSKWVQVRPSLLYNTGRVLSYTVIGGIAGSLGSVVGFSGSAKGIVAMAGGILMVIIGINMLDIFPWLRRIRISAPKVLGHKIYDSVGRRGPFLVGVFNGLMPCGPLQTMQLYALGTGSFLTGATSMFLFSLGTVPLMFGFGAVSSFLSHRFTQRMVKVGAVLVIVLGLIMVGRGLNLSGVSVAASNSLSGSRSGNIARIENGIQVVTTTMESGRYQPFVVQKGLPVRWIIKAKAEELNGCNNPLTVPKYNIRKQLVPGDNIIEFTPAQAGNITYTCWMGMISSTIRVVDNLSKISQSGLKQAANRNGASNGGGGCCASGVAATRFQGGRVPTDDIQVAQVVNGIQEVTVNVNDRGYSPAAIVLQRGLKAKIKFNPEKLNSCNNVVIFPEYNGQLDLREGQVETPLVTANRDFTFQCWMGMLHGYVKVVDDLRHVNLKEVQREIENYKPAGGGGCCGG